MASIAFSKFCVKQSYARVRAGQRRLTGDSAPAVTAWHLNLVGSPAKGVNVISASTLMETNLGSDELVNAYRQRLEHPIWNIRDQGDGADASWLSILVNLDRS